MVEHKGGAPPTKGLNLQNHREKEAYLQYEVRTHEYFVKALRRLHTLISDLSFSAQTL